MKADIHPEYVVATVQLLVRQHVRRPARPRPTCTSSCAASATPSTRASRSWWTPAAASTASSAATASAARPSPSSSVDRSTRCADPIAASALLAAKLARARRATSSASSAGTRPRFPAAPRCVAGSTGVGARSTTTPLRVARARRSRGPTARDVDRAAPPRRGRDAGVAGPPGRAVRRPAAGAGGVDGTDAASPPSPTAPRSRRAAAGAATLAGAARRRRPRGRRRGRHRRAARCSASRSARRHGDDAGRRSTSRLEVGVGHADRELTAMLHGDLPPADAARAGWSSIVRAHRRPGADAPPAQPARAGALAARRRWSRDPALVGARRAARRAAPPCPRRTCATRPSPSPSASTPTARRSSWPARSASTSTSCPPPPTPALALAPDARLVLVVPARDAHPVTRALAARLGRRPSSSPSPATGVADRSACATGVAVASLAVLDRLADLETGVRRRRGAPRPTPTLHRRPDALPGRGPALQASSRPIVDAAPRAAGAHRRPRGRHARCSPSSTGDDREVDRGPRSTRPRPTSRGSRPSCSVLLLPEGPQRRQERHRRDPRRRGRRGGQPLRPRPVRDVPGLRRAAWAGSSRCSARDAVRHGRLQRGHVPAARATACGPA